MTPLGYKKRKFSFELETTVDGAKDVIAKLQEFMEKPENEWAFEVLSFENF